MRFCVSAAKRAAAAAGLVAGLATAPASAALFHFQGHIAFNSDVVAIPFTLNQARTDVRVWTDSFLDGRNYDPITVLWDARSRTKLAENDDDAAIDPATQTRYDSGFHLANLAAGDYVFTVAAYPNFAGASLDDPFDFQRLGNPVARIADWCQPGSDNCNNQKGTAWSVWLDGVDSAGQTPSPSPNTVPEPGAGWLAAAALAAAAWVNRRRPRAAPSGASCA